MEENIKENQLTFTKGMSNVPSDNLCDDNCLSDCIGLRVKDGEIKAIQSPLNIGTVGGELIYVHKSTYTHLIVRAGTELFWYDYNDGAIAYGGEIDIAVTDDTSDDYSKVKSIGNTLIVNTEEGLKYAVWRSGEYKVIGGLPDVSVAIRSAATDEDSYKHFLPEDYTSEEEKIAWTIIRDASQERDTTEEVQSARNELVGLMEGAFDYACKEGYFTFPFWVRVALRLYDGSYAKISPPVLAFPTVRRGAFVRIKTLVSGDSEIIQSLDANASVRMQIQLLYDGSFDGLEDIVDKVVIFMSDQVKTWSDDGTNPLQGTGTFGSSYLWWDGILQGGSYFPKSGGNVFSWTNTTSGRFGTSTEAKTYEGKYHYFAPPYNKTDKEIMSDLINASVFYKAAEIEPDSLSGDEWSDLGSLMAKNVLLNITTQEQLEHDDYYGHCKYYPKSTYVFNNRLQIANIKRIPWNGTYYTTSQDINYMEMTGHVYINGMNGGMTANIKVGFASLGGIPPCFFFYPDPNAKYVNFSHQKYGNYTKKLTVHPRLNGAYYFQRLPSGSDTWESDSAESSYEYSYEELNSKVMTSEVNNPWVFNAEGDNTVGTGEIIGLVSNTRALSQGQFGQHPLIVFTTEGIYALGTNSEGLYSTNYPLSREVCNNPKSITPTDGAVFFTSEKGLMMMVGSDITCVSQQMMGKKFDMDDFDSLYDGVRFTKAKESFADYIKDCFIAYDYKNSALILVNPSYAYNYIYDLKSGAFTRQRDGSIVKGNNTFTFSPLKYTSVVNDYPDNLLQDSKMNVYSLIHAANPDDDELTYDGILLSRPVKFGDAQTLKSLRQILHVKDITGSMQLHVYVSNNLKNWGELTSLRGMGWKYFRFGIELTNMRATDSYSGMIAITQNRRTDKLR